MAYQFHGFFIKGKLTQTLHLEDDIIVRDIDVPFSGQGVRLPQQPIGDLETVLALATVMAIPRDCAWIYLDYTCWGGLVERVWGYVHGTETSYGPLCDDSYTATESFQEILQAFGVLPVDAADFVPFHRGFWGEPVLLSETVPMSGSCWV